MADGGSGSGVWDLVADLRARVERLESELRLLRAGPLLPPVSVSPTPMASHKGPRKTDEEKRATRAARNARYRAKAKPSQGVSPTTLNPSQGASSTRLPKPSHPSSETVSPVSPLPPSPPLPPDLSGQNPQKNQRETVTSTGSETGETPTHEASMPTRLTVSPETPPAKTSRLDADELRLALAEKSNNKVDPRGPAAIVLELRTLCEEAGYTPEDLRAVGAFMASGESWASKRDGRGARWGLTFFVGGKTRGSILCGLVTEARAWQARQLPVAAPSPPKPPPPKAIPPGTGPRPKFMSPRPAAAQEPSRG
jgi:hypothetical protein